MPGAAARSLLKTVHWTVFRARQPPHTPSASEQLDGKKLLSVKEIIKTETTYCG